MDARDDLPRPTPTTHRVDLDGEVVLVDLVSRRGLRLNASALAVWEACDGTRRVDDVIDEVAGRFAVRPDVIADDVRAAVDELRTQQLLQSEASSDERSCDVAPSIEEDGGVAYLDPAPSPCRRSVDALPWAHTVALAVAGFRVGVRTMSAEVAALVERSYERLVVDDERVASNFSVMVDDPGERRNERRYGVYDGHEWRGADADADAVIDLLGRRLAALHDTPPGSVRLDVVAARGPGGVVLLAGYGQSARFLAVRNAGWAIVPGPVLLRPSSGGWDADVSAGPHEHVLGLLVAADDPGPCTPAVGLQLTVPHAWPAPRDDRARLVSRLAELVAAAPVQRCPRPGLPDALDALGGAGAVRSSS